MTLVRWWKLLEEQTSTSHSIPTQFNTNLIANCDELSFGENCMLLKCRWDNMQTFILLCHHEFWFYYVIWFNFVAIWFGVQFKTIVRTHAVFIALLSWMKDGCNWFIIMCWANWYFTTLWQDVFIQKVFEWRNARIEIREWFLKTKHLVILKEVIKTE